MPEITSRTPRPEPDVSDPATYRWWIDEHVRFSDTDLVGHVNNLGHCAFVETARVGYSRDLFARAGIPLRAVGFVRLEIDFRAELRYPARVRVGARPVGAGRTSFTIITATFHEDRCVNTARNVMVHLGADGGPAPLPDALRALLNEG